MTRGDRSAMSSELCLAMIMSYWRAVAEGWWPDVSARGGSARTTVQERRQHAITRFSGKRPPTARSPSV